MNLSGQVKARLFHPLRQDTAQHLQIQGDVAVEIGIAGRDGGAEPCKGARRISRCGWSAHRPVSGRGDQALPIIATSVAKSSFSTSMPSPRV